MDQAADIVHLVWIGDRLPLMGQLSIRLLQRQRLTPHLWCYGPIADVPAGVVLRDAAEVLPKDSVFSFQGHQPGLENGGKGSVSHWSDIFQLLLLQRYGGWYSQLDVACLKMPTETPYYFAHHQQAGTINTFVMKLPQNAPFLTACLAELTAKVNRATSATMGWLDGMKIIGSHVHAHLPHYISRNNFECGCRIFTDTPRMPAAHIEFVHWCNALCGQIRNGPTRTDSLYYRLLHQEGLA